MCFAYPLWGLLSLVIGGALHAIILYPMLTPGRGGWSSPPVQGSHPFDARDPQPDALAAQALPRP